MTSDPGYQQDLYGEPEDTAETGLWARLPLVGWLRRTSRGLGRARGWFLPLGFWALLGLAAWQGRGPLGELAAALVAGLENAAGLASGALTRATGGDAPAGGGVLLDPGGRYWLGAVLQAAWAVLLATWVTFLCWPLERDTDDLGYVVPGSGWLARGWAVIGRQLYRLRVGLREGFFYLRDINIEKLVLPPALLLLLGLGVTALAATVEDMLFELHLLLPGLVTAGGWQAVAGWAAALGCGLLLGVPLLEYGLRRLQRRARERRRRRVKLFFRMAAGWGVLLVVAAPAAWMVIGLLAQ